MPSLALSESINAFALDLYARLKEQRGNLFFSPYSISSALALAYAGARGRAAAQMAKALRFDQDAPRLHAAFGRLAQELYNAGERLGFELRAANALWVQRGYRFLEEFLALTQAALNEVDFQSAPESACQAINSWVGGQTRQRIREILPPGALDPLTRLVLVNVIYFKGRWAYQFSANSTYEEPFTLASGERVPAQMMHQTESFGYRQGDGFQALEMSYRGRTLSMVILLPAKAEALPALEEPLTAGSLDQWLSGLRTRAVVVAIPKFRAASAFSLDQALRELGMSDAFSLPAADFSGMTGGKDLAIGTVIHKAFVDVDEAGTEAAAATALAAAMCAPPEEEPPPVFRADHPFIFLIRDNASGTVIFMGRLANPIE